MKNEEKPDEIKNHDDHISDKVLSKAERKEMKDLMRAKLNDIQEGEPAFDVTPFINKKVEIEDVRMETGEYGEMIKAETEILGYYETEEEKKPIRASVLFSVYIEDDGAVKTMKFRPNSKLAKFMNRHNLENVGDLIGCQVTTTLRATEKGDFISFI